MSETNKNTFEISDTVRRIGTSEAYQVELNSDAPEVLVLDDRGRRLRAIRLAAHVLKNEQESGYMSLEGHKMNITGQLTTFYESLNELRMLKENRAKYHEKIPARRKVAEFNHAVKDMIDSNSTLTFNEVKTFILSMNQAINGRQASGPELEYEVSSLLVGMSHEIAFEQMLGFMPGVEYEEATIDDDLHGADFLVSIDNSPMTPIDVKASQSAVRHKKAKAAENGYTANGAVWSHIDNKDFNGSFRIPNNLAKTRSVDLYNDLKKAIYAQHTPAQQYAS